MPVAEAKDQARPAVGFGRLPPELLPLILAHLAAPSHLLAASLVCQTWAAYATEILYAHVWVRPWQKGADRKLVLLLETLSSAASLARRVRRLEIRSYPPPQMLTASLAAKTLLAFLALPNLTSLAFTRDHSLSPQLLRAVATCMPALRELEINAHATGSFEPVDLLQIRGPLVKLVLVMPDKATVGILELWLRAIHDDGVRDGRARPGLHELSILSKFSPLVNDALLSALAPSLPHLRALSLTASTRVTADGILGLLRAASSSTRTVLSTDGVRRTERGVTELALESLDHLRLDRLQPYLIGVAPDLRWLSITSPSSVSGLADDPTASPGYLFETFLPPFAATLETLHVGRPSAPSHSVSLYLPAGGFPALRTLSLPPLSDDDLPTDLARLTPRLEHLFLAWHRHLLQDLTIISQWRALHTIHLVVPGTLEGTGWEPTMQDLRGLAQACPSLRQVGFRTRVYDVLRVPVRSFTPRTEGREEVVLERFDLEAGGRVPDVFLLGRFLG